MESQLIIKGAVISGGGAFGAMGAGTLARLDNNYNHIVGISTGALMAPLVGLNKWDILREAYTSVSQNDIIDKTKWYEPNTFTKKGGANLINLAYSQISGKLTAGTTFAMRKLIDKFITEENYLEIREKNISLAVGCQNLQQKPSKLHYFDINDDNYSFEDFKDWMWASANAPLFTSLISKKWYDSEDDKWYNGSWTDGGLTQLVSLDYLCNKGCNVIDVIIHREFPNEQKEIGEIKDLLHNGERSYDAMRHDVELEELPNKIETLNKQGVTVNLYWLPRKLANNSLIFNKAQMQSWYDEGYETAFANNRMQSFKP